MKFIKITLLFVFMISFFSCNEKNGIFGINDEESEVADQLFIDENFGSHVSRDFIGQVVDVNGMPISGVSVSVLDKEVYSDINGVFILNKSEVYENFATLKVIKSGYHQGAITSIPTDGINRVKVVLLENTVIKTIKSGEESTVAVFEGASIKFDGNFIKNDGTTYEGEVNVSLHYIEADKDYINNIVGIPYAKGIKGAERFIESYGIVGVELTAADGSLLDLADEAIAEVSIAIDASLVSNAPSKIALWSFDYKQGFWKEEGEAILTTNNYMGRLKDISFINFGKNYRARAITTSVKTKSTEDAINNQLNNVEYTSSFPFNKINSITNETSISRFIVPADVSLTCNVLKHSICGEGTLYSTSITPGRLDQSIDVKINNPSFKLEKLEGTFTNCSGTAVQEGYVFLKLGDKILLDVINNGEYSMNFLRCDTAKSFSIEAFDYINDGEKSINMNYLFSGDSLRLGEHVICNTVSEVIQYTIDGSDKFLLTEDENINVAYNPSHPFYSDSPYLAIYVTHPEKDFSIIGVFNLGVEMINKYDHYETGSVTDKGMNISQKTIVEEVNDEIDYYLAKIGEEGEFIDIHFQGNFQDESGVSHSIVGMLHVIR